MKQPNLKSGKTRFTRGKAVGESWTTRRAEAVKAGEFKLPDRAPVATK